MQYSPKLKKAMEDIKAILKENDIAGVVVLHTPFNSEFFMNISPSYSCAKSEPEGMRIRARLQEDFAGDKTKHQEAIKNTSNMLSLLSEVTGHVHSQLSAVSRVLDNHVQATHFDRGNTSHNSQNN